MVVFVPCCGESTRFKGLKKQFLTHPIGIPLPIYSVTGLTCKEKMTFQFIFKNDEFLDRYGSIPHFQQQCKKVGIEADCVLINRQTNSPVETVLLAIAFLEHQGAFYVKDCDNFFRAEVVGNSVATMRKTFLGKDVDETLYSYSRGMPITEIKEHAVISPYVNVGGYGFDYTAGFRQFSSGCYTMSDVIGKLIEQGGVFTQQLATEFESYGNLAEWNKYLTKFENL